MEKDVAKMKSVQILTILYTHTIKAPDNRKWQVMPKETVSPNLFSAGHPH